MSQISPLNTLNPDYLLYQYEQIHFEILGGIKLDVLNNMRATIKVKHFNAEQRHTLDLYNNNALQRFLKTTAESLEVGIQYIQKATGALINELEAYRLQEMQKSKEDVQKPITLTEAEKEETINFLKHGTVPPTLCSIPSPLGRDGVGLLHATNELLGQSGIIGEEVNRIIMYLIFTTRKLQNPLHIISLASSGTGKSYLQEKVSQCIPEEDKKEITSLSPNSFYYQEQTILKHKLILLEDLTGAESSMYPIRELQSKKYIIKEVSHKNSKGDTITITKKVEGPVCIAACTTDEQIYEDNANRSFLIYLDDSEEQDQKIMDYQRKHHAGKIDKTEEHKAKQLLQNVQRILKPVTIINPYAEYLQLPEEVFKKRRTNAHYLQFIEAITFYKQYQKKEHVNIETGEVYIETSIEDIQEANNLIRHILLRKSDELNGATRDHYEKLKSYLQQNKLTTFINREIRTVFRIPATTVRRYHNTLIENNYIKKTSTNKAKGYRYEIVNPEEYNKLKHSIDSALAVALQKAAEQTNEPQVSQKQNGSLKKQKNKQIQE
jgi:hypothetical protein